MEGMLALLSKAQKGMLASAPVMILRAIVCTHSSLVLLVSLRARVAMIHMLML